MTTPTESAVERWRLITEARGTAYRAFRQLADDDEADTPAGRLLADAVLSLDSALRVLGPLHKERMTAAFDQYLAATQ
jgi:hypothetical protein